jgi:alpha-L-arabinofuranosidase
VHVGGDGLRDGDDVDRELTTMQAKLQEWTAGTSMKACIFEENGGRHDMQRALGHAHILNVTERHGDFVLMDCPANCLQPWLQNDNGWDQGQLFFTPDKTWGMPPYYAQQMTAENYEPLCVQSEADSPNRDLDVTATRSEDGKTLVLKVVNLNATAHHASITLDGFPNPQPTARTWTLSGDLTAVNTPTDPKHVQPVEGTVAVTGGKFEVDVKAYSYMVIRIER